MVPPKTQAKVNEKKPNNFPAALILGLIGFNIGVTQIFDLSIIGSIHWNKLDDAQFVFSPTGSIFTGQEIACFNYGVSVASGIWIVFTMMTKKKLFCVLLNFWLIVAPFFGGISAMTYGWFMNVMQKELGISHLQLVIGWAIAILFLYGRVILYFMVCVFCSNISENWPDEDEDMEKTIPKEEPTQYTKIDYNKLRY